MATEGLNFVISGDNKALIDALQQSQRAINDVISQIENGGKQIDSEMNKMADGIDGAFKKIAQAAGGIFAVSKAKEFLSEIVDVRKEFQSLELSFATLTGDANKGKKLFSDITKFATSTPMLEKDLAKGAQTLLGFNIEAEKVMPILKQIGDISMGDSQKFESLTLSFAQASSTGKLMGQDLLQMINAGFNPLVEISRTTGKSISELKDEMSEGKISVEMLQNAFKTATEEGGKFHGMLNGMANGLEGSFSNLEGAFQKLFNDLGQEMEGPIVEGANLATEAVNGLAENLETVGNVIGGLVATFGVYKTACLAVTAVHAAQTAGIGAMTTAQMAHRVQILLTQKAQALLNATMLANPYVAVATALAAVAAGLYAYANRATGAEQAQKGLNDAIAEQKQAEEDRNTAVQKAISLASDANKADTERKQGIQTLVTEYGSIIEKYIDEEGHLTNIIALKKEIALLDGKKTVNELQGQSKQYAEYAKLAERALKGRASMSKADNAALDEAMKRYSGKTGGGKYDYSRARQYFAAMAKGTANQAGTTATQANVNSFAAGIGAMSNKQLQKWQGVLKNAQALAKSGSLVNIQGITRGASSDQINGLLTQINGALNARSNSKVDKDKKKEVADIKSKIVGSDVSEAIAKLQELQKKSTKDSDLYKYYDVEIRKLQLKQQKAGETLENQAERQAAAREKLQEELTALERKNQEDENNTLEEGLDKKLAILKSAHEEEIEELQKQATDWARENKKAKMSGATAKALLGGSSYAGLTAAQVMALQNSQSISGKAYDKAVREAKKQTMQSKAEYLKGSKNIYEQHEGNILDLQNKRDGIDQNDEWALKSNQREIDEENARFADELAKLQTGIEEVWQNFDTLSEQALDNLAIQLQEAVENGIDGQKISEELANDLSQKLGQIRARKRSLSNGGIFSKGGTLGGSWIGNLIQMSDSKKSAASDYDAKKQANDAAKQAVADAEKNGGKQSKEYQDAKRRQNQTQKDEDESKNALDAAVKTFKSGSAKEIIGGINQNAQSLAEAGKMIFGEDSDIAKVMGGFASASQGVSDMVSSLESGDFAGAALSIGTAVSSFGESLGLWSSSNRAEVEKENERLASQLAVNSEALGKLTDKLSEGTASDKYDTYKQAENAMKSSQSAALQTMLNNAGMYDGGHSLNYDFYESFDGSDLQKRISSALGQQIGGLSDFLSVSPDKLYQLYDTESGRNLFTEMTQAIINAQDDGNYNGMVDDLLSYISSYNKDAYDALEMQYMSAVTGTSLESFKDEFKSTLMDMESDTQDFADNFTKQLTQSILDSRIEELYGKELEQLYKDWNNAISDGTYAEEADRLKARQEALVERMQATRDQIAEMTGYDDVSSGEASGTINSAKSMTEDTANELVGRMTAVQLAVEGIRVQDVAANADRANRLAQTVESLNALNDLSVAGNEMLNAIHQEHVTANSYLSDIAEYNRQMYENWDGEIIAIRKKLQSM